MTTEDRDEARRIVSPYMSIGVNTIGATLVDSIAQTLAARGAGDGKLRGALEVAWRFIEGNPVEHAIINHPDKPERTLGWLVKRALAAQSGGTNEVRMSNDPTRFTERSFTWVENAGHSVRLQPKGNSDGK